MESKIIKVVDEHGIDRDAKVMFSFDVNGSEYISYKIERDTDNDNVFVSKLIKNIDGTSSLINIDSAEEKETVSKIVKELIEYAIHTEELV